MYRHTGFVSTDEPDIDLEDLAQRRRDTRALLDHLRFVQDAFVDQQLVKEAILRGASQNAITKAFSMSKVTVNRHTRLPFIPAGRSKHRAEESAAIDRAFLAYVWGSDEATAHAFDRCREYDAKHFTEGSQE